MKSFSLLLLTALLHSPLGAEEKKAPVKVYILAGQSNMVGIGQVTGNGNRWGDEFQDATVSVYEGAYDASKNYDTLKPIKTLKPEKFGGVKPTSYPGGGTQIARGTFQPKTTGVYEFRPGYGGSTHNIMTVNGVEVYRRDIGREPTHHPLKLEGGKAVPFQITYLNDQASSLGWIARVDIPGTLSTVVKQDGKFPYLLKKNGGWVSRDDVWYRGVVTATANKWLSPGCGAGSNQIGPELGFGHLLGNHHDEPVLILKASQGNRSLSWDFLPPGSEQFEHEDYIYAGYKESPGRWEKGSKPTPAKWYAGKQYDDCFGSAQKVLANFNQEFPHWKGRGYEIAGFAWWQGHKDGGEPAASRYEQNLVQLIKTLRAEFEAPAAPFVVATIGFGGWKMKGPHQKVAEAQLAVGSEKYPEFQGNVTSVETRDFWIEADKSPKAQSFHYNQNAEVYMHVGEAMGKGMLKLLTASPAEKK